MELFMMTNERIEAYAAYLRREEKTERTVAKYLHDLRAFSAWVAEKAVTKELVTLWKGQMLAEGRSAVTVNGALAALHGFFTFMRWDGCRVKYLKVQRQMFRDTSRELTRGEYLRLVETAKRQGNARLALLL